MSPQRQGYYGGPGNFSRGNWSSPDRSPGPKPPDLERPPAHSPVPDMSLNAKGQVASAMTT